MLGSVSCEHRIPPCRDQKHSVPRSVPIYSLEFSQLADVARFFVRLKHVAATRRPRRAAEGRRRGRAAPRVRPALTAGPGSTTRASCARRRTTLETKTEWRQSRERENGLAS